MVRVAIGADHHGVALKARLGAWLVAQGHEVDDRGTADPDAVVDYPPLCLDVCTQVVSGAADRGLVLGGSGQGEAVACNKVRGVRAGLCPDVWSATISRGNNDANVLVLGVKVVAPDLAEQIVAAWFATEFRGGVHARRVAMIAAIERGEPLA